MENTIKELCALAREATGKCPTDIYAICWGFAAGVITELEKIDLIFILTGNIETANELTLANCER